MANDLRTRAIVLRRTNYGETDRILSLLTPEGRLAVLAKGVRKERSRLAGGIELFSVSDVVVHQGRSELGTLTGAKMLHFYGNILGDVDRLELAGKFLKCLNRITEQVSSPEHFTILQQALLGLDRNLPLDLVEAWFELNLARASGEEANLLYDVNGAELDPDAQYLWDMTEKALTPSPYGSIGAREIKFARFLLSNQLLVTAQVGDYRQMLPIVIDIARSVLQLT